MDHFYDRSQGTTNKIRNYYHRRPAKQNRNVVYAPNKDEPNDISPRGSITALLRLQQKMIS